MFAKQEALIRRAGSIPVFSADIIMDYNTETHKIHSAKVLTVLVDIDETICFYQGNRTYEQAIPEQANIDKINDLYDQGWKVIYWTARGSTQPTNLDRLSYITELTQEQLNSWGARHHDLIIGDKKPLFDLVIDDKAKRIEEL